MLAQLRIEDIEDDAWLDDGKGNLVYGSVQPGMKDVLRRAGNQPGHIFNTGHGIDYVKCTVQGPFVIFQHRLVERAFNNRPDIVPVLFQYGVEIINIYSSEYNAEKQKQNYCRECDDRHHPTVDS